MIKRMRKLIFFDIDGTLISKGNQVLEESTKEALRKARANGHICIVNTGRTWRMVGNWLPQQTEFDGYLLGCGTMVRYGEEILLHRTFSPEDARRIMAALDECGIDALLEGADNNYAKNFSEFQSERFRDHMRRRHPSDCLPWKEAAGNFDKFLANEVEARRMELFRQQFREELSFIDRDRGFWEIAPKGYSKGSAMTFLADRLQIPMADTVAVGDSNNDLEMFQSAGTRIAMGNAVDNIKNLSDFVTTDVLQDGIWNALSWLGAI